MLDTYPLSLTVGFLVGLRHSTEADHIVAVSTVMSEERTMHRSLRVGAWWGAGHTAALLAAAACVSLFERAIPAAWTRTFELGVAFVIVFLGARLLRRSERSLHHDHAPASFLGPQFSRGWRPLLVGIMHGLAGSGALTVAFLTPLAGHGSTGHLWLFLLLFGCGSTLGMMMMSAGLSVPLKRVGSSTTWTRLTHAIAGLGSIGFGIAYAWRLMLT